MKKIYKGILALIAFFVLMGIAFGGLIIYLISTNNTYRGDYKVVLEGQEGISKKALIVYQPDIKGKTSETVASQIAKGINEQGYQVTISYPGKHLSNDVHEYSILVFASPVYAGKCSTVLTDYMKGLTGISEQKVIIYSVGSMENTPELVDLENSLSNVKLYAKTKFNTKSQENDRIALELGKEVAVND